MKHPGLAMTGRSFFALGAGLLAHSAAAAPQRGPAPRQIAPVLGLDTHAPVTTLTTTALHNLGVQNLAQALRLMPLFSSSNGLGTGKTSKFSNGAEQSADLCDLTNSRVVFLINGQRWVQGLQGSTDPSTFPVALI